MTQKQPESGQTCLLVLSMHRSGSSALARVLNLMGAALPRRLMGAGAANLRGHWEPERLVLYHDQLLRELGSAWHDWRPLDLAQLSISRRDQVKAEIRSIVKDDYADAPLFVLKDPRICRFAEFFMEALREGGIRVAPVINYRNPLEVFESLRRRGGDWSSSHSEADAALLWISHVLEAETATRDHPRAIVSYDRVLGDWKGAIASISAQTGVAFPVDPEEVAPLIEDFLGEDLRHHHLQPDAVSLNPLFKGWASELYELLTELERAPETASAKAALERLSQDFTRFVPVIDGLVSSALEAARGEATAATSRLTEEQAERARLQAELERQRKAAKEQAEASEKQCEEKVSALNHAWSEKLARVNEEAGVEIAGLAEEIKRAQQQTAQVEQAYRSSTCWKITAPLRAVKLLARKLMK